jgi:pyruvate dehydrogenase E2 component (dihydrolipoamide acetyltransferase)
VKGRAGVAARADAAQRAVGELMARSKREIPHYYLSDDLDVTDALAWLRQANEARPVTGRLLPAALLLRAVVRAALEAPELNGHWIDGSFRASKAVHLAIAVSTRAGGLLAPVIPDAHLLPLDDLMQAMQDAVARARTGTLRSADVEEATITVTNLGDQGAGAVWGVIVPPQVAIVGFGRIGQRPWAVDGLIGVRDIVTVTLAADHRASHGHRGSRFLAAIDHALRRPEDL